MLASFFSPIPALVLITLLQLDQRVQLKFYTSLREAFIILVFSFPSSLTDRRVPRSPGVCWIPVPAKALGSFCHICSGQVRIWWPVPQRSSPCISPSRNVPFRAVAAGRCKISLQNYLCEGKKKGAGKNSGTSRILQKFFKIFWKLFWKVWWIQDSGSSSHLLKKNLLAINFLFMHVQFFGVFLW